MGTLRFQKNARAKFRIGGIFVHSAARILAAMALMQRLAKSPLESS
jgi:hypothetical protein